ARQRRLDRRRAAGAQQGGKQQWLTASLLEATVALSEFQIGDKAKSCPHGIVPSMGATFSHNFTDLAFRRHAGGAFGLEEMVVFRCIMVVFRCISEGSNVNSEGSNVNA
ncbi:hypothetical protein NKJ87_34035, partial [Mesorhizobium sp. M0027]|uniref:hypothetical protein n=1 Tax=Mesorhizobium sp. M0027 TaxID=2956848 RepID=UPI003337520F